MHKNAERTIDQIRRDVNLRLDTKRKSDLGQFMTPSIIAEFMVSLFSPFPLKIRLLDPGAGVGSLSDAFYKKFKENAPKDASLYIEAFEIEPILLQHFTEHFEGINQILKKQNLQFSFSIKSCDFIEEFTFTLAPPRNTFTHVILNPPYKKIGAKSVYRKLLRDVGIETVNLYTAFLGLTVMQVEDGGEIVAILPRSFCNGTYFRHFRQWLFNRTVLTHIHIFESRSKAFKDDDVLQENIIIHLKRSGFPSDVTVSTSHDSSFNDYKERIVPYTEILKTDDTEHFIHIPTIQEKREINKFTNSLEDLEITVSTGPVVDFRVKDFWLKQPAGLCAPLLYAHHFKEGGFKWPKNHKKPNALKINDETRKWLMPQGFYTITKRFSAKEEPRRIVAYVIDPGNLPYDFYGIENHLNFFHVGKRGLPPDIAYGLALFLNSSLVDQIFRIFSGHTQVNASDLRYLRYPSLKTLQAFGKWAMTRNCLDQSSIDNFINQNYGK